MIPQMSVSASVRFVVELRPQSHRAAAENGATQAPQACIGQRSGDRPEVISVDEWQRLGLGGRKSVDDGDCGPGFPSA